MADRVLLGVIEKLDGNDHHLCCGVKRRKIFAWIVTGLIEPAGIEKTQKRNFLGREVVLA